MTYDAIVLGLGAAGSATVYQMAKKGRRVLGIDRYAPPHPWGSSHGGSRITRLAVAEGEVYAPIVRRSHEIWREIEGEVSEELIHVTGGLVLGEADGSAQSFLNRTIEVAQVFSVPHEVLDAREIRKRFPQFIVREGTTGYYEPTAGFLRAERCVDAQLTLAKRRGAEIHINECGLRFEESRDIVRVVTDRDSYECRALVLCVGPWAPRLLGNRWRRVLNVTRETQFYFDMTEPDIFSPDMCPVFIWELDKERSFYGFPAIDGAAGGIKITLDADTSPDAKPPASDGLNELRMLLESRIAGLSSRVIKSISCSYTSTPDSDFIIDSLPGARNIWLVSACSGHGFKHSAAVGEIVSQLLVDGRSEIDIGAFQANRFN